eukprot:TRINITY_DN28852_c0_g1_i2.p1 TRINITY_DN28852_c0_g1~~TRINITY_DN28852_c0_g1_i2.p1  ORF type:complete len:500 (-),score=101.41 TRINITY_DN28852_c0_g1_i2:321-1820(-)
MLRSLVGSEMCIRDSTIPPCQFVDLPTLSDCLVHLLWRVGERVHAEANPTGVLNQLADPPTDFADRVLSRGAENSPAQLSSWLSELFALKLPSGTCAWDPSSRVICQHRWNRFWRTQIDSAAAPALMQHLMAESERLQGSAGGWSDWEFEARPEELVGANTVLTRTELRNISLLAERITGLDCDRDLVPQHGGDGTGALGLLSQVAGRRALNDNVLVDWSQAFKKRVGADGLNHMVAQLMRYHELLKQPVQSPPAHPGISEQARITQTLLAKLRLPISLEQLGMAHGWDMSGWLQTVPSRGLQKEADVRNLLDHLFLVSSAHECIQFIEYLARNLKVLDHGFGNKKINGGGRLQVLLKDTYNLFRHALGLSATHGGIRSQNLLDKDQAKASGEHVLWAHGGDRSGILRCFDVRANLSALEWREKFTQEVVPIFGEAKTVFLLRHLARNLKMNFADEGINLGTAPEQFQDDSSDDLEDDDWKHRLKFGRCIPRLDTTPLP